MTWDELKEEAKKMGYKLEKYYTEELVKQVSEEVYVTFSEYGSVVSTYKEGYVCVDITISEHRTPDQMLAIMKALQQKE